MPLQRRQFGPGDHGAVVTLLLAIVPTVSIVVASVAHVLVVVGVPVHVIVMSRRGHHVCVHGVVFVTVFVKQNATARTRVEDQRRKAREEQERANET